MSFFCGGSQHPALEMPEAGGGYCCMGAVMNGPQGCTCWVSVYDLEQQALSRKRGLRPLPPVPLKMCGDCAFRPGSPERAGADGYEGDQDLLDELVATGNPFYCHQGVRRTLSLRHPDGAEVDGHPGDYDPPIAAGFPWKADGTPADLCAGWLLLRAKAALMPP
jgi:hypothetical protein